MSEPELGRRYADGEVICRQGDVAHCMYVIQAGSVEIFHEEGGRESRVGEMGRGELFGEMGIFDRAPRSATVRAKGEAWILTLDKRMFFRRVDKDPSLAFEILRTMSRRLRALEDELALVRNVLAGVRVVRFVLVVDRDRPELFELLCRELARDRDVEVVLDRRLADAGPPPGTPERRGPEDGWTLHPSSVLRGVRAGLAGRRATGGPPSR